MMMTTLPHADTHKLPPPVLSPTATIGRPVGHLVCDPHGHVSWADDLAGAMLADAQVVLLQPDGRLGVRSHRLGLLALRSAMRLAVLGTPAEPLTLRHGHQELQVGVHALPEARDGTPRVLVSLRPTNPVTPVTPVTPASPPPGLRTFWRT
jgi:hypothetical protein